MTQSGASQAVQQLEDFLQVQLLDRTKRPFVITDEGELFYSGCCKLVRQFDNLAEEVRSLGQEISGRATIAAIYSVGLSYLPDLQKVLKARYPKTEVRFQFCHPDEVYRAVEQGSVDFGLVSYPQQSKTISAAHWRDEPMVLAAPAGHHLASQNPGGQNPDGQHSGGRERVTPEDLGLESLIAFAPNLRIRHEIDRYLRSIGITMPIAAEFDNVDSVKHALGLNGGVAFLPRPAIAEELESGTLVALRCDWLTLQRPLGVIQRRDTSLGRTARAFYELMFQAAAHDGTAAASVANPVDAESSKIVDMSTIKVTDDKSTNVEVSNSTAPAPSDSAARIREQADDFKAGGELARNDFPQSNFARTAPTPSVATPSVATASATALQGSPLHGSHERTTHERTKRVAGRKARVGKKR